MPHFDHPAALAGILLLVPALFFLATRVGTITQTLSFLSASKKTNNAIRRIQRSLVVKFSLRALAWISLMLALSGLSWGSRLVPVQKSGDAVCFVFDISYSMQARDGAPDRSSRLDAARLYADALIQRLQGEQVAVVLAKGDGIVALPLTEDYASLSTLLESLSPRLMSAPGSSLGKGIRAALTVFPQAYAQASHIWVFTDGDETDGALDAALDDCVRYGRAITFVGFGTSEGADILAGDGKTTVHTVLQEEKLKEACELANKKHNATRSTQTLVRYERALAQGAAARLLGELENGNGMYTHEVQTVSRRPLFLLAAVILFILSFITSEFDSSHVKRCFAVSLCIVPLLCTSCKSRNHENLAILASCWQWYQKQYHKATAGFLHVQEEARASQYTQGTLYATFGLSATYLMQQEYEAALEKLQAVDVLSPDCPPALKSAVYYNKGVIAHQNGDYNSAIAFFKQAVLADSSNISAKINLELTDMQRTASRAKSAETEMKQVAESKEESPLEKGIFNLIKEQEQEQWKKMQANQKDSDTVDY